MTLFGPVPSRRQRALARLVTLALAVGAAYEPAAGNWRYVFQAAPEGLGGASRGHSKVDRLGPDEGDGLAVNAFLDR